MPAISAKVRVRSPLSALMRLHLRIKPTLRCQQASNKTVISCLKSYATRLIRVVWRTTPRHPLLITLLAKQLLKAKGGKVWKHRLRSRPSTKPLVTQMGPFARVPSLVDLSSSHRSMSSQAAIKWTLACLRIRLVVSTATTLEVVSLSKRAQSTRYKREGSHTRPLRAKCMAKVTTTLPTTILSNSRCKIGCLLSRSTRMKPLFSLTKTSCQTISYFNSKSKVMDKVRDTLGSEPITILTNVSLTA